MRDNSYVNSKLEKNIEGKIINFCNKNGKFNYQLVFNKFNINYNELNIIEKKVILNKINYMHNIIIIHKSKNIVIIPDLCRNITGLISKYERKSGNKLFSSDYTWIKLLDDNNKEINISQLKNAKNIKLYAKHALVKHGIRKCLCIPYVNLEDKEELKKTLLDFRKSLSEEELQYFILSKKCRGEEVYI